MAVFITGGQARERVRYVGWLRSSGTQWVDLGIKPTSNTRVVCDFEYSESTNNQVVFGAADTTSNKNCLFLFYQNGNAYWYYGTGSVITIPSIATDTEYTVDANKNNVTLNDTQYTSAEKTFSTSYTLHLFACNIAGTDYYFFRGKIRSCKVYEGDVLVRDVWPCYDPDGVPAMYDRVEKEYHYNGGSGELIAGGEADTGGGETGGGDSGKATVAITGSGSKPYSYVTIGGTTYTSAASVEVDTGTVIYLNADGLTGTPTIKVNGTTVSSGGGSYEYTVTSDCTVTMTAADGCGHVTVTTS